jgi:hypothetical protein
LLSYLLDIFEAVLLAVIGVVLYKEHLRLSKYFASQIGGGVGSDVFMLTIVITVFVAAAAHFMVRTMVRLRNRGKTSVASTLDWRTLYRPILVFACVAAYAVLIPITGYLASSIFFFALFSRLDSKRLLSNVVYGVGMGVSFYLVFELLFETPFPRGVFFP